MPGIMELSIIAIIVAVLFGHKRIPQLMTGIGDGIRGLRAGFADADELEDQNRVVQTIRPDRDGQ